MSTSSKPPLTIYVIWHPGFEMGKAIADTIYNTFTRNTGNPDVPGINIPTNFRNEPLDENVPKEIDLDISEKVAVVVLVDEKLLDDKEYKQYVIDIHKQVISSGAHILYPVAITDKAYSLDKNIAEVNFIRMYEEDENNKIPRLIFSLSHELCRLLYDVKRVNYGKEEDKYKPLPPVKLFLSHAKEKNRNHPVDGGERLAQAFKNYILTESQLDAFFDARNIAPGDYFGKNIEHHIEDSTILVFHSDRFTSRPWCRREILLAKTHNRPIVVLNAFKNGEERIFPYMANVPCIHLKHDIDIPDRSVIFDVLQRVLLETLRCRYQEKYIEYLVRISSMPNVNAVMFYPPELLTLVPRNTANGALILYPDPPLGEEELELLENLKPGFKYVTPNTLA